MVSGNLIQLVKAVQGFRTDSVALFFCVLAISCSISWIFSRTPILADS